MSIELAILIAGLIGIWVGVAIERATHKERDKRLGELEKELNIQRNVVKALNEDNVRLRKRLNKKNNHYDNKEGCAHTQVVRKVEG